VGLRADGLGPGATAAGAGAASGAAASSLRCSGGCGRRGRACRRGLRLTGCRAGTPPPSW